MDATERLVYDSEVSAAVLGKGDCFVLINSDNGSVAATEAARAEGFYFCGVVGLKSGRVELEIASPDRETVRIMGFALREFADMCSANLVPESDFTNWMTRLHALVDPRTQV